MLFTLELDGAPVQLPDELPAMIVLATVVIVPPKLRMPPPNTSPAAELATKVLWMMLETVPELKSPPP